MLSGVPLVDNVKLLLRVCFGWFAVVHAHACVFEVLLAMVCTCVGFTVSISALELSSLRAALCSSAPSFRARLGCNMASLLFGAATPELCQEFAQTIQRKTPGVFAASTDQVAKARTFYECSPFFAEAVASTSNWWVSENAYPIVVSEVPYSVRCAERHVMLERSISSSRQTRWVPRRRTRTWSG